MSCGPHGPLFHAFHYGKRKQTIMASVIYSPLVDAVRGKAGSAVFVHGRTGPVLKPRVKPANPKTAAQQGVRNNISASSKSFKG